MQTKIASAEHKEHDELMKKVQAGIDALLSGSANGGGDNETSPAVLLDELKANLSKFGKELLEHLDHEEHSLATPVARKVSFLVCSKSGFLFCFDLFLLCRPD